ncbi:MAG: hypothetical protein HC836_22820 [Richelia sp. RM2_1_2]|nr:hypothetical protein [Richelia sp. RM2_1_2]
MATVYDNELTSIANIDDYNDGYITMLDNRFTSMSAAIEIDVDNIIVSNSSPTFTGSVTLRELLESDINKFKPKANITPKQCYE